ncbi:GIY-YIG nuclease family protein [Planomicrobium sp. YIM 101495]|uniref:GIY-YIG nuclease family protein n=1 Tax=Planomicrobium sp. YIM 101495 TaxID=2665160 RepID=UPI0012B9EBB2|nr:GIY-YIG nuclease family protein [Planomicrobium sp. YIM 101495]MTD32148.1 GIY-YIG nuclease family protein [Planomicrobium sp. YIM 101495]
MGNEHFFYVLECADGSYYAGYAVDVEKRVATHNAGKGAKYTRAKRPVVLLHQEAFGTKTEAMRAEYAFKQLTKAQKIQHISGKQEELG